MLQYGLELQVGKFYYHNNQKGEKTIRRLKHILGLSRLDENESFAVTLALCHQGLLCVVDVSTRGGYV